MKFQENAKVLEVNQVVKNHYKISLFSPNIAKNAKPGQFVMVKCESDSFDPLLRRPISIHKIEKDNIELLFKVIGKGTKILSELKKNDPVNLIGPLGNEFKVKNSTTLAIILGGGVGIAPMLSLAEYFKDKVKASYVIIGSNNKDEILCEKEFNKLGSKVIITTDDGSSGKKGRATDVLVELMASNLISEYSQIFACGPRPMYKELNNILIGKHIDCQVSMEEWMACGIGACNGCTCDTKQGYKKICKDGPIFDIKDIKW